MSGPPGGAGPLGFQAFGSACGLAVLTGALARFVPGLGPLTAALAALALAGWAALHRPGAGAPIAGRSTLALGLLGAVAVLLVVVPPPLVPWRPLLLGLALVPLWLQERGRRTIGPRGLP